MKEPHASDDSRVITLRAITVDLRKACNQALNIV